MTEDQKAANDQKDQKDQKATRKQGSVFNTGNEIEYCDGAVTMTLGTLPAGVSWG